MISRRQIIARGGCGGDGCVSFRREKHVPFGGPNGGDGGDGGNVIVVASPNVIDLSLMSRRKEFVAGNGRRGGSWRKHGKRGEDLAISVPIDTMVFTKADSGETILLADLRAPGQGVLVAKGVGEGWVMFILLPR